MKEVKDLILSVGFDLDKANERKLKASLDKQTFEMEKQQREAKQLSQTLEELNAKREKIIQNKAKKEQEVGAAAGDKKNYKEAIARAHSLRMEVVDLTAKIESMSEDDPAYKDTAARLAEAKQKYQNADREISQQFNDEKVSALRTELASLASELEKVDGEIEKTSSTLDDINAKINVSAANVEVARQKVKEAHIPKSIKEAEKSMARFDKRIKSIAKQALVYGVIAKGLRTMVGYMGELLKSTPQYAEQLSQIKGNLMVTGASLWTAFEPAMSWLLSALNQLTQLLAVGVSSMLGQTRDEAIAAAKAFDKLTKSSKRSTSSLDTLHKLGDGGILTSYEALENIDEEKWDSLAGKFEEILKIGGLIGAAILTWKVSSGLLGFFSDVKTFFGSNGTETLMLTVGIGFLWDAVYDYNSGKFDWASMLKTALGSFFAVTAVTGNPVAGLVAAIVVPISFQISFEFEHGQLGEAVKDELESQRKDWEKAEAELGTGGDKKNIFEQIVDGISTNFQALGNTISRWWDDLIHPKFDYPSITPSKSAEQETDELTKSNEDLTDTVARATAAMETLNRYRALSTPHVPRLATGTVIPPNNPYLAVVGDQKHGTNVEAPLETIVDAMRIALREQGNGGRDITVIMQYDGREFGRAVYHANNEETQRVGVRLAKT